jgi:TPR repeat protein
LGHAYDIGQGVRRNTALAIKWYRRAVERGETIAAANMATVYRDRGQLRVAHQWYIRAMDMHDGDAAVDAGYGYLYGVGVRRDLRSAKRLLRVAVRSTLITESGREEALYHLAIAEIDSGRPTRAIPLLEQASKDDDYPEAASLLAQIREKTELRPCRCRRDLYKHLPGHAKCPQHTAIGRTAVIKMKR